MKLKKDYRIEASSLKKAKADKRIELLLHDSADAYAWGVCTSKLAPILRRLTPGQRAFSAICALEAEVLNGGIHQYLWNSTGSTYHEAIAGLELIGATEHARLLRAVGNLFPGGRVPTSVTRRRKAIEKIKRAETEKLFDDPSYALEKGKKTRLSTLLLTYLKKHPEEFLLPEGKSAQAPAPAKTTDYRVSRAAVAKLTGEKLHWKLIENLWDDYWEAVKLGEQSLAAFLTKLTAGQRALVVIDILNKAILHLSGFEDFFGKQSCSRIMAEEAVTGFDLISAKPYLEVFNKAHSLAGEFIRLEIQMSNLWDALNVAKAAGKESEALSIRKAWGAAREQQEDLVESLCEPLCSLQKEYKTLLSSKTRNIERFIETYAGGHLEEFVR